MATRDRVVDEIVPSAPPPRAAENATPRRFARGTRELFDASRHSLQRVEKELVAIDHFVNDLLDLSAMGSGRLVLQHANVDLAGVVRRVWDRLGPSSACEAIFDVRDQVIVRADLARTERVMANLVWCAIDRAPAQGLIIRIEKSGAKGRLSTTVLRTAEVEPRPRPRHGLGLYVSRRVIEAQGGSVGVQQRGALVDVFIELPLA